MRALQELRAARAHTSDERAELHAGLLELMSQMRSLEERIASVALQEEALESILQVSRVRVHVYICVYVCM